MPKLAKSIEIMRLGRCCTLTIDGEEFAWYLADEPVTTTTDGHELGTVNLTIAGEHVTVIDDIGAIASSRTASIDCRNHQARQHRDGKEPWCNECELTEDGREPTTRGS